MYEAETPVPFPGVRESIAPRSMRTLDWHTESARWHDPASKGPATLTVVLGARYKVVLHVGEHGFVQFGRVPLRIAVVGGGEW